MPNPMTTRQKLIERRQRIADIESEARQELQRLEAARSELDAQLSAEDAAAAEAAVLAEKSGIPADVARQRIARERADAEQANGPADVFQMTSAQYAEHKLGKGI